MHKQIRAMAIAIGLTAVFTSLPSLSQPKGQPADKGAATWQQSAAVNIQLGVRDKLGTLGTYDAEFTVKDDKGGKFKIKRPVKGDAWSYVYFPSDFSASATPGDYHWKCIVGGKEVISGKFKIKSNGGVGNELKISEQQ